MFLHFSRKLPHFLSPSSPLVTGAVSIKPVRNSGTTLSPPSDTPEFIASRGKSGAYCTQNKWLPCKRIHIFSQTTTRDCVGKFLPEHREIYKSAMCCSESHHTSFLRRSISGSIACEELLRPIPGKSLTWGNIGFPSSVFRRSVRK